MKPSCPGITLLIIFISLRIKFYSKWYDKNGNDITHHIKGRFSSEYLAFHLAEIGLEAPLIKSFMDLF